MTPARPVTGSCLVIPGISEERIKAKNSNDVHGDKDDDNDGDTQSQGRLHLDGMEFSPELWDPSSATTAEKLKT